MEATVQRGIGRRLDPRIIFRIGSTILLRNDVIQLNQISIFKEQPGTGCIRTCSPLLL